LQNPRSDALPVLLPGRFDKELLKRQERYIFYIKLTRANSYRTDKKMQAIKKAFSQLFRLA
jgi:hypothetical protein